MRTVSVAAVLFLTGAIAVGGWAWFDSQSRSRPNTTFAGPFSAEPAMTTAQHAARIAEDSERFVRRDYQNGDILWTATGGGMGFVTRAGVSLSDYARALLADEVDNARRRAEREAEDAVRAQEAQALADEIYEIWTGCFSGLSDIRTEAVARTEWTDVMEGVRRDCDYRATNLYGAAFTGDDWLQLRLSNYQDEYRMDLFLGP